MSNRKPAASNIRALPPGCVFFSKTITSKPSCADNDYLVARSDHMVGLRKPCARSEGLEPSAFGAEIRRSIR